VPYGRNVGEMMSVTIGSQRRTVCLSGAREHRMSSFVHFDLREPSEFVQISVAHAEQPPNDDRHLGVGMVSIQSSAPVAMSAEESSSELGGSLFDGLDLAESELPPYVAAINGLGAVEPWGRWSTSRQISIDLHHVLAGRTRLGLLARGYGRNAGEPITITIGNSDVVTVLPAEIDPDAEIVVELELSEAASQIVIGVPHPTAPPCDARTVGIGLRRIRLLPNL